MTFHRLTTLIAGLALVACAPEVDTGYERLGCDGFGRDVPSDCHVNVCFQYETVNSSGQVEVKSWNCLKAMRDCCDATPNDLSGCTIRFTQCRGG